MTADRQETTWDISFPMWPIIQFRYGYWS